MSISFFADRPPLLFLNSIVFTQLEMVQPNWTSIQNSTKQIKDLKLYVMIARRAIKYQI